MGAFIQGKLGRYLEVSVGRGELKILDIDGERQIEGNPLFSAENAQQRSHLLT